MRDLRSFPLPTPILRPAPSQGRRTEVVLVGWRRDEGREREREVRGERRTIPWFCSQRCSISVKESLPHTKLAIIKRPCK